MQANEDSGQFDFGGTVAVDAGNAVQPERAAVRPAAQPAATMEAFLREVEARAFRIAMIGVRDRDEALDIVQDAMIRLVRAYARKPSAEWPPLFYRILGNRVRDAQRRRSVRNRWFGLFARADDDADPFAAVPGPASDDPLEQLSAGNAMAALDRALDQLPARQREAFVLRVFEGLDVASTALAMGCSEGSVKTHHSRALARLQALLGEHR